MDEDVLISERFDTLRDSTDVDHGVVEGIVARADRSRRRRSATYVAAGLASVAVISTVGWGIVNGEESGSDSSITATEDPSASTPSATGSDDIDLAWRNETETYREALFAAAGKSTAFVAAMIDDSDHALVMFGTGGPPVAVEQQMADAPAGTSARWQSVPFTQGQLQSAMNRAVKESDRLNGASYGSDFASVTVYVWPADETADRELQSQLSRTLAPIPVVIEARPPAETGLLVGSN